MESQIQPSVATETGGEFTAGAAVVYSLMGRCTITAVETKQVAGEAIRFYKLEVQKSTLSRTNRQEPAIWVPVTSARARGLRTVMTPEELDAAFKIFENREYYFQLGETWSAVQPKIDALIRQEGGIGLAKAISYLFVLKRKQIVPASEVARTSESITRLFVREAAEILNTTGRVIEDRMNKALKHKLIPDT